MAQSQNFNGKSIAILRSAGREIYVYKRIPSVKSQVRIKVKIKEFMNRGLSSKDIHKHYDIQ